LHVRLTYAIKHLLTHLSNCGLDSDISLANWGDTINWGYSQLTNEPLCVTVRFSRVMVSVGGRVTRYFFAL